MDGTGATFELAVTAAIGAWIAAGYPQDTDTYKVTNIVCTAPGGVLSVKVHVESGE